jgi:hypothetical protein
MDEQKPSQDRRRVAGLGTPRGVWAMAEKNSLYCHPRDSEGRPGDKFVLFVRCPSLTLFNSEGQGTAPGQGRKAVPRQS